MDTSHWKTEIKKEIPQQMNGSDCGMFTCKFAEYLSRRARISFTQQVTSLLCLKLKFLDFHPYSNQVNLHFTSEIEVNYSSLIDVSAASTELWILFKRSD